MIFWVWFLKNTSPPGGWSEFKLIQPDVVIEHRLLYLSESHLIFSIINKEKCVLLGHNSFD